jgi:hypothetical protein
MPREAWLMRELNRLGLLEESYEQLIHLLRGTTYESWLSNCILFALGYKQAADGPSADINLIGGFFALFKLASEFYTKMVLIFAPANPKKVVFNLKFNCY